MTNTLINYENTWIIILLEACRGHLEPQAEYISRYGHTNHAPGASAQDRCLDHIGDLGR